jgi:hypothetical protein
MFQLDFYERQHGEYTRTFMHISACAVAFSGCYMFLYPQSARIVSKILVPVAHRPPSRRRKLWHNEPQIQSNTLTQIVLSWPKNVQRGISHIVLLRALNVCAVCFQAVRIYIFTCEWS